MRSKGLWCIRKTLIQVTRNNSKLHTNWGTEEFSRISCCSIVPVVSRIHEDVIFRWFSSWLSLGKFLVPQGGVVEPPEVALLTLIRQTNPIRVIKAVMQVCSNYCLTKAYAMKRMRSPKLSKINEKTTELWVALLEKWMDFSLHGVWTLTMTTLFSSQAFIPEHTDNKLIQLFCFHDSQISSLWLAGCPFLEPITRWSLWYPETPVTMAMLSYTGHNLNQTEKERCLYTIHYFLYHIAVFVVSFYEIIMFVV